MDNKTPSTSTCDLCDRFRDSSDDGFRVLPGVFRSYGGRAAFHGQVVTLRCYEANAKLKELVQTPGEGRVIVVDGGASMQRALLGGNLAGFAAKNGWAGVLINGVVRDLAELRAADVGIFALGHCPMPSFKREEGQQGEPLRIQGEWIRPDEWIYAAEDGVVVYPTSLSA
jgi:regulator of ribonuclease activity A